MPKLGGHNCGETELKCFDCRAKICRECMVQSKTSLLCKRCDPNKKMLPPMNAIFADGLRLQTASVSVSFIAFALLGCFANCVT